MFRASPAYFPCQRDSVKSHELSSTSSALGMAQRKRGGPSEPPLPEEVETCLSKLDNIFKKKQFKTKVQTLLRDPLLWLRIEHTEQQVNEIFGNTFKSTPLEITTEDYLALRYRLCDEVLKEASGLRDYQSGRERCRSTLGLISP